MCVMIPIPSNPGRDKKGTFMSKENAVARHVEKALALLITGAMVSCDNRDYTNAEVNATILSACLRELGEWARELDMVPNVVECAAREFVPYGVEEALQA